MKQKKIIGLIFALMLFAIAFVPRAVRAETQGVTFTVNSTVDEPDANPGDGKCRSKPSHVCTLRAAIMENNTGIGHNIISLPAGTYQVSIPGDGEDAGATGDLDIVNPLTIQGSYAPTTIINVTAGDRAFDVFAKPVGISDVTIKGGFVAGDAGGGIAIHGAAGLKLTNVILTNNHSNVAGGAIWNANRLTITSSTIGPSNSATYSGGGIWNTGTLKITKTRIYQNHVVGGVPNRIGGGIYNTNTLTLIQSTLDHNRADYGAGLYNTQTATLANSTIADNTYDSNSNNSSDAAGIYNAPGGGLNMYNVTIADNISGVNAKTGGLYNAGGANAYNSILDRNKFVVNPNIPTYGLADCYGPLSGIVNVKYYNLIFAPVGCNYGPDPSTQTNVHAILGTLQNNGGFTPTEALGGGSPAIDKGNPKGCLDQNSNVLTIDQRNSVRPTDGDNNGKARCDIGAYEK